MSTHKLIDAQASAPFTGEVLSTANDQPRLRSNILTVTGTGAVSATAVIEGNNTGVATDPWIVLCTLTASGTTAASDQTNTSCACQFRRARLTAISGTGAAATLITGA